MGKERENKGGAGAPWACVGLSGTTWTSPQPPSQRIVSLGGRAEGSWQQEQHEGLSSAWTWSSWDCTGAVDGGEERWAEADRSGPLFGAEWLTYLWLFISWYQGHSQGLFLGIFLFKVRKKPRTRANIVGLRIIRCAVHWLNFWDSFRSGSPNASDSWEDVFNWEDCQLGGLHYGKPASRRVGSVSAFKGSCINWAMS